MKRLDFIKLLTLTPLIKLMNLNELGKISEDFKNTERMPILFLGHGSPMNALRLRWYPKPTH